MPQTVLGLDIGPNTIKAVVFSPKGLTGGRILAARTLDINACGGIDTGLKKTGGKTKFFPTLPAAFACRLPMSCSGKSACLFTMIIKSEKHWLLS